MSNITINNLASNIRSNKAAVSMTRPLLLTPNQDIRGYLLNHVGRFSLLLITCSTVLAVFLIFYFVIKEAAPFLREFSIAEFLGNANWHPEADDAEFGTLAIIVGSLYITVISILIAVPIGLLAAVFLSDIVSFRIRSITKPIIELLAAIPSVAYGFYAVLVLAPWMQKYFGLSSGTNILNASLMLAVMALPTIVSVAEDALTSAGRELRGASYGLGATRFETISKVVMPAASSGIIVAIILGIMRAIGETMVVWMAAGNANQFPSPWWNITSSVRTMTATIAGDMAETPKGSDHYLSLFALAVVLLLFTFTLNLVSEYFMSRARKKAGH